MPQILWQNSSSQPIKWMTYTTPLGWQGNMIPSGQSYTASDAGVQAAGFSESGFTGIVYSLLNPMAPYSGVFVAVDNVDATQAQMAQLLAHLSKAQSK